MKDGKKPPLGRSIKKVAELLNTQLNDTESLQLYRSMVADGRIASLYAVREATTLGHPYVISSSANQSIDEFINGVFTSSMVSKLAWQLSKALAWGFVVIEVEWELNEFLWLPKDTSSVAVHNCYFKDERMVYMQDGYEIALTTPKFLTLRRSGLSGSVYGESIFHAARAAFVMKEQALKYWLQATERFSVPPILALLNEADANEETVADIAKTILDMRAGAGGALAGVSGVQVVSMQGAVRDFETLVDWCNKEISYALTGQSLATGESKKGTYALGAVHQKTMRNLVQRDVRAIAYTIQQLINLVVEINFGAGVASPQFRFETNEVAPWERIQQALAAGVPVSRSALYDRYGLPRPIDDEDTLQISRNTTPNVQASDSFFLPDNLLNLNEETPITALL